MTRSLRFLAGALGPSRCEPTRVAGVEALVARPAAGSGRVAVYANAATPHGIEEPAVARLLTGLAAAGFVAVAPELPGVRRGEVTPQTLEALVRVAIAAGPRVTLLGASTGAGLALLAAAELGSRVDGVAAIAPFASLRSLLRLGTTGWYGDRPCAPSPLVRLGVERSLRAAAPDDDAVEPLLENHDPGRFDALYGALAADTRSAIDALSPINAIPRVEAPVEVVCSPVDAYCPLGESRALVLAGADVRLTVTRALDHVCPRLRPGLVPLLALLDRTLRRADAAPVPVLRPAPAR
jgi:pimeloyl-ACP methyl ester carboxylesterase